MHSGISPYLDQILGQAVLETPRPWSCSAFTSIAAANQRLCGPIRRSITLSRLANAPPQDDSTFVVSISGLLCGASPALRRYRRLRALEDLQQRLLHALAGDVAA